MRHTILIAIFTLSFSAIASPGDGEILESLEISSESSSLQVLNLTKEIEKQEKQLKVVVRSFTDEVDVLENSKDDPLQVTLITKARPSN